MYPLEFLNSKQWKLTLPDTTAQEIKIGGKPDLATYASDWFRLNATNDGVIFKVPSNGGHTKNSINPRSELRELNADGSPAAWSTATGVHSMECEFSVDVLPYSPKNKPHVVTGQIHDGNDDVTVFRVEGNPDQQTATIWITDGNKTHGYKLTDSYKLGDRYRVGFNVENGAISYNFNGVRLAYFQVKKKTGCYFKVGTYNQDGGDTTKRPDGENVYAQVTLYAVQVCHSSTSSLTDGQCTGRAPGAVGEPAEPPPVVVPPTPPVIDVQPIIDALNAANTALASVVAQVQAAIDKLSGMK